MRNDFWNFHFFILYFNFRVEKTFCLFYVKLQDRKVELGNIKFLEISRILIIIFELQS